MKCHKCGFVSFDYLSECKKCGISLEGSRSLLGLMDFKPTLPFFLGAMINAQARGSNGGSANPTVQKSDSAGLTEIEFGDDLEFEIEEEVPAAGQYAGGSEFDSLPQIELPEGFSLSLGEEEKGDELELVIGPDFEQALSIELDAKDFEQMDQPIGMKDDLDGLELGEPVIEFSASVPQMEGPASEAESLIPELSLDIALEMEPAGDAVPTAAAQPVPVVEPEEENMVIDFSQSDFENLLVELDDGPADKRVGQSALGQQDSHA